MAHIFRYSIIHNIFTALKILRSTIMEPMFHHYAFLPSLPSCQPTDLFTVFSRISYSWGHTACNLLTLASFARDFSSGLDGKESACNAGDPGLTPRSGRSPGEENGYSLQCSSLENPWTEEPGGLQSMGSQRVGHD